VTPEPGLNFEGRGIDLWVSEVNINFLLCLTRLGLRFRLRGFGLLLFGLAHKGGEM